MSLKNRGELVDEMYELLKTFDKNLNKYCTDVYAYYDAENNTAELDTFVNIGGRSWLDDDHYTIYSDPEHNEGLDDFFPEIQILAGAVDMTKDELIRQVAEYNECDSEEVEYRDCYDWIREYRLDNLQAAYACFIDDANPEYFEKAEQIISEFEDLIEEKLSNIKNAISENIQRFYKDNQMIVDWERTEGIEDDLKLDEIPEWEKFNNFAWYCYFKEQAELFSKEKNLNTYRFRCKRDSVDIFYAKSKETVKRYILDNFLNSEGDGYSEEEIEEMIAE